MSIPHTYRPALFALLLSGGLLAGAWISQYGFGYAPCQMCYWQRHAHKAVVVIAIVALLATKMDLPLRRGLNLILVLVLLGSAGLAFYHSGVEFGFWDGPKTCSSTDVNLPAFNSEDPFAALDQKIKPPSCSEAVWFFLGLSMATWNGLLSLGGAVITLILGRAKNV